MKQHKPLVFFHDSWQQCKYVLGMGVCLYYRNVKKYFDAKRLVHRIQFFVSCQKVFFFLIRTSTFQYFFSYFRTFSFVILLAQCLIMLEIAKIKFIFMKIYTISHIKFPSICFCKFFLGSIRNCKSFVSCHEITQYHSN